MCPASCPLPLFERSVEILPSLVLLLGADSASLRPELLKWLPADINERFEVLEITNTDGHALSRIEVAAARLTSAALVAGSLLPTYFTSFHTVLVATAESLDFARAGVEAVRKALSYPRTALDRTFSFVCPGVSSYQEVGEVNSAIQDLLLPGEDARIYTVMPHLRGLPVPSEYLYQVACRLVAMLCLVDQNPAAPWETYRKTTGSKCFCVGLAAYSLAGIESAELSALQRGFLDAVVPQFHGRPVTDGQIITAIRDTLPNFDTDSDAAPGSREGEAMRRAYVQRMPKLLNALAEWSNDWHDFCRRLDNVVQRVEPAAAKTTTVVVGAPLLFFAPIQIVIAVCIAVVASLLLWMHCRRKKTNDTEIKMGGTEQPYTPLPPHPVLYKILEDVRRSMRRLEKRSDLKVMGDSRSKLLTETQSVAEVSEDLIQECKDEIAKQNFEFAKTIAVACFQEDFSDLLPDTFREATNTFKSLRKLARNRLIEKWAATCDQNHPAVEDATRFLFAFPRPGMSLQAFRLGPGNPGLADIAQCESTLPENYIHYLYLAPV